MQEDESCLSSITQNSRVDEDQVGPRGDEEC